MLSMTCLIASCAGKPVTLVSIDMQRGVGHREKITDVNKKECKIVSEKLQPVPLVVNNGMNPMFDKGFWISEDDFYTLYNAWLKDCKSEQRVRVTK